MHKTSRNARMMHNKYDEPDGEHNANTYFGECDAASVRMLLKSFQDFGNAVTAIKTRGCIKVVVNPTSGNVVA